MAACNSHHILQGETKNPQLVKLKPTIPDKRKKDPYKQSQSGEFNKCVNRFPKMVGRSHSSHHRAEMSYRQGFRTNAQRAPKESIFAKPDPDLNHTIQIKVIYSLHHPFHVKPISKLYSYI